MFDNRRPEKPAEPGRVEQALVEEQVVADTIGFLSGVKSGPDLAFAPSASALFSLGDSRDVLGGMEADEEEGIAQGGVALLGDMADAAEVARLFRDEVEAGESPKLGGGIETVGMAEVSQVPGAWIEPEGRAAPGQDGLGGSV